MPIATRPEPSLAPRAAYRCGSRRAATVSVWASEHAGRYEAAGPVPGEPVVSREGRGTAAATPGTGAGTGAATPAARVDAGTGGPPFGLPVLAELPRLASVLDHLAVADAAQRAAIAELADLLRDDAVERTTGVGVDHWLAAVARLTRMDRRLLVRTCRLLHRLPALDAAVRQGRVSFAQLRGLALVLRGVRGELDAEVDRVLAALLDGLAGLDRPDPDVLVRQVADTVDELDPADLADRERDATANRFLSLQPRLDGTGGRVTGELDAAGLALLDAATAPSPALIAQAGGVGPARADLLLARLAAADAPAPPAVAAASDVPGASHVPGASVPSASDVLGASDVPAASGPERRGPTWWEQLAAPRLVLRLRLETLLDPSVPAELLTSLLGGRLKLTAAAARRLTDERGALLRTVVVDEAGAVLGVGRATRRPPGWVADAVVAVHDTCTGPGCDRPARTCQRDHAAPWWPTDPERLPGRTDVTNIGPLCDATNRQKEAAGWRVAQTTGGVRTWHHPRSGLTTTTVPSTWRPPDDPRQAPDRADDRCRHRRRPPGSDPPGPDGPGPEHRAATPGGPDLPF
jgi:hypothetical protein